MTAHDTSGSSSADEIPIADVPDEPRMRESPDELRARIPGWGVDLETGIWSELSASGSLRRGRSDRRHQLLDPIIVAGPWVGVGAAVILTARRVLRRVLRRS